MNQDLPPPSVVSRPSMTWTMIGAAALVALLILYRPYAGVSHDARVYIGEAMAALDPGGVGRDLMFAQDRQTAFSIFPALVRALVALAGPAPAALALTVAGLGLWLAAAVALAARLARGRLLWAMLACILVLAPVYGGLGVFGYAEPFATPRPLAEAAVMAALAALMARRRLPALALLGLAAAIHPIMALPGAAAAFVVLVWEDRRWLWAGAAAILGVGAAAALGLPLADRLFQRIDPVWLQLLRDRNSYLFVARWTAADFSRIAVQLATLALAASYVPPRARMLLAGIAAAGLGGLLASWLFVDLLPSLLMAQMQTWRGLWLLSMAANAALALAATGLWRQGGGARLALAALALAWLVIDAPLPAVGMAAGALVLQALARRGRLGLLSRLAQGAALTGVAMVTLVWALRLGLALGDYLSIGLAAGAPVGWPHALETDLPRLPLAAAAIALALGAADGLAPRRAWAPAAVAALALLSVATAAARDGRTAYRRMLDAREGRPVMKALLADAPGPILWVGGDTETWMLADRANWSSDIQGAGMVFSRPLAIAWDARIRALIDLGLARPQSRRPFAARTQGAPVRPTRLALIALCARGDGPAAVVVAGRPPEGIMGRPWRPAWPRFYGYDVPGGYAWRRVAVYSVIPCAATLSPLRP